MFDQCDDFCSRLRLLLQEVTELVNENESLRIESKERELIIKALIKNKNKRKYAAKDLGISERTLYRKIKHYNLDKDH